MENTDSQQKKSRTYKIIIGLQLIIIAILAVLLFTTKSSVDTVVLEKEKSVQMSEELQVELDSLMAEHDKIKKEYGYLSDQLTSKDSTILSQAKEIETLINSQADYRRIKKKLDALRQITQGYVGQIDSLYRVNQSLTNENTKIKGDLDNANKKADDLTKEKDDLSTKINDAAYLKGYNVTATGYNMKSGTKESITDRARKVELIRVCLTIGENPLVSAGQKDVYVRIARPDNIILTQGSYSFIYQGQRIQYTSKTVINYTQKSSSVCIDYPRDNIDLPVGKYHIAVFADDHELGQCTITLR
ncbi:MAG: hypothetical protein A2W93_15920 [Bacteroidetes bacterium GWF2_43_63]|nr:MAG: hypothetical protein A2W94_13470 [Bacteroidetes bacterium GWE2_42_42]OFY53153.1 MAG: hypothetical protein A2W93_15920 [Bacteroidetes bacterium GWF2_43_63]HBG70332.1 hypothetical protein [Bacteroidales bacterium]HCB60621.1 hypothetical protein [Bacteroidales bacterium]HCY22990.1 hypothetical protein [Bacteroidales bacterium]